MRTAHVSISYELDHRLNCLHHLYFGIWALIIVMVMLILLLVRLPIHPPLQKVEYHIVTITSAIQESVVDGSIYNMAIILIITTLSNVLKMDPLTL